MQRITNLLDYWEEDNETVKKYAGKVVKNWRIKSITFTGMCLDNGRVVSGVVCRRRVHLAGAVLLQSAHLDNDRLGRWWRLCHVTRDWQRLVDVDIAWRPSRSRWTSCEVFSQVLERRVDNLLQVETVTITLTHAQTHTHISLTIDTSVITAAAAPAAVSK